MRKINKIIIHHSASPMNKTTFEDIKRWHLERGFNDIGYHWVIDGDGELWKGRPESKIGAHCKGHNRDSIGICLIGNFQHEEPTENQIVALEMVESLLRIKYDNPQVIAHCAISKTKCPGIRLIQDLYMEDTHE